MEHTNAYVELKDITKTYGDFKASDHVSFSIEKGRLIGLLGPSGSGKTTILRILAGLESADSGAIYIDGRQVDGIEASKRGIGFVFQNYALFRYKTVYENIAFGMKIQKYDKAEIRNRTEELIELVGLKGMEHRMRSTAIRRAPLLQGFSVSRRRFFIIKISTVFLTRQRAGVRSSDRNF